MKTTRYILAMMLMCIAALGASAQRANVLTIDDIVVEPGKTAQLPVAINNTDAVVGMEFDIILPAGITTDINATPTNRMDDHQATIRNIGGDTYKVLLYSPTNKPLRGNNGAVFSLNLHIPSGIADGTEYPLSVENAVLGISTGANVLTGVSVGKIIVSTLPDLTVKNIQADKTEFNPGENIIVSWTVENLGQIETGEGWSEQISLISEDGTDSKLIATEYYRESLGGRSTVNRQAEITLPDLLGIDGRVKVQVRIVPFEGVKERSDAQENNTRQSDALYSVNKLLLLELSPTRFIENEVSSIYLRLKRSGKWSEEQTFNVTTTADSRINIPATITIPAGQSGSAVYLSVTDNTVLDNDSIVDISIAGNGYAAVTQRIIIEDNEYPDLSVAASKSVVNEGETFQLTVSTSRVSGRPIGVNIVCEDSKRFTFPAQVTIPAGSVSASFNVEAIDNNEIEQQETVGFSAIADHYNRGEVLVLLNDNDMPTLSFTLSPSSVSEAAGNTALMGVIKRTDNLDKTVILKLSDNNNGWLTYPSSVTMQPGESELEFTIGVKDNNLADGDKTVELSASVYASSCNCSIPNENNASMSQSVTIIDDEGPVLTIKASGTSLLEGSTDNVFSVSHNLVADHDVTVNITSDKDELFEYDHTLVIPAGSQSANLLVDVKQNSQYGDSDLATFTVQSNGLSIGTCWVIITDQTMPDAIVSLTADKTEAEAGGEVRLTAEVKNIGHSELPASTELVFTFSGESYREKMTIDKALEPGESKTIEYVYALPSTVGDFTFQATVNPSQKVTELMYVNNSSEKVTVKVTPSFSVTAQTDKDLYNHGEKVTITGKAIGDAGKSTRVEVYMIHDGIRQAKQVMTDEEGNYILDWQLLEREAGHFIVGACYPGTGETTEMDAFNVYGILLNGYYTTCQMGLTETFNGSIQVTNPGVLTQTNLKVEPKAESENCEFTFSSINQIAGGETATINFSIKGNGLSQGTSWQEMPIVISTNEGSIAEHILYYFVQPLTGALQASTTHIDATMTLGKMREYPITVRNIGKGETGKITFALPNWVSTATAKELPSLNSGDSTTVVLRFEPTDEMKLNVPVQGQLGINCANGNGVGISFTITPVSDETGTLTVDVVDEMTFFTDEAPHVANAHVVVKAPVSGNIVAEGVTGEDGKFVTTLAEGWYTLSVEADSHNPYSNTLIVNPGINNEQEVFLSYNSVTYTWEVVETEVEDVYEIETVVEYETRVPKPVVIVTLPENTPEPYSIVPMTVTNVGLISAVDVNISLTMDKDYYFEFLTTPHLDELGANESHIFYSKMMPLPEASHAGKRIAKADNGSCYTVIGKAKYKELCDRFVGDELAYNIKRWGTRSCLGNPSSGGGYGGGGYGGGYGGGGYGGGGYGGGGYGGGGYGPGSVYTGTNTQYNDSYIIWDTDDPAIYCTPPPTEIPSGEPEEVECGEPFNLNYKLISNDGKRHEMRGVAADRSELLIVLDPRTSQIPSENCGFEVMWSVPEGYGTIKNPTSWNNVQYQAPDDFPEEEGGEVPFTITMTFKNSQTTGKVEIPVVLARVPLILIHGLNSSSDAWQEFADHVTDRHFKGFSWKGIKWSKPLYDVYQVYCLDYSDSNCSHFVLNQEKPGNAIRLVTHRYKNHGIMATKADLVGHSMGGILSRLHVQYVDGGRDNVHKIITVNTPHSGSEWGDYVMSSEELQYLIKEKHVMFSSTDAIEDLAVNSSATDDYLNNPSALEKMKGIPVHALSSVVSDDIPTILNHILTFIKFKDEDWDKWWLAKCADINILLNSMGSSDLVVSLPSQQGGLSYPQSIGTSGGVWNNNHMKVTTNSDTWDNIILLLNEPTISDKFSLEGFNPVNRIAFFDSPQHSAPARLKKADSSLNVEAQIDGNILHVAMDPTYMDYERQSIDVIFSNGNIASGQKSFDVEIPSVHEGAIRVISFVVTDDGTLVTGEKTVNVSAARAVPVKVEMASDIDMFSNEKVPVRMTCTWDDGSVTTVSPESAVISSEIAGFKDGHLIAEKAGKTTAKFTYKGLSVSCPITIYEAEEEEGDESESICTSIKLSFKQEMVMTRQAFRGTLTVNNGSSTGSLEDVKLNLEVRNSEGKLMTSHEFQINPESLEGFTGQLDFTSGWTLGAQGTGVATILFIPTKYAAPTGPEECSFGGTFSYKDPTTGLYVTRDLKPVTLTVKPSPELDLDYFMQRDVYGDDPLTEDVVEPSEPAEFALLINNKGYGDATNVRMTTQQPEIIDNEKGLLIDFEILSSQVNGGEENLAFGESIVNDFGTIEAGKQTYAQWWLQSSLLGHFTDYNVSYNHLTSYGNEDLSLLDQVRIHELIHGFTAAEGIRGFLVNDIEDADDLPDMVYLTDASHESVSMAATVTVTTQGDDYLLTVTPSTNGWTYGSLIDPTDGKQEITSIIRQSDGVEIPLDNIWRTDRTLRDGKDPVYEYRIHFVGNILTAGETYLVSCTPKEQIEPDNTVTGIVTAQTSDGQPVTGAMVTLRSGDVVYTTSTDATGSFTLNVDDTSKDYVISCTAEGYIDGQERSIHFTDEAIRCDYVLLPGATVYMPSTGLCTYSGVVGLDFTQASSPVKAYYGKLYNSERVLLEEVECTAAGEGLVLQGEAGSRIDIPAAYNATPLLENVLTGTAFEPYTVTTDNVYVLANLTGQPKFHQADQGLVIPRFKAYLLYYWDGNGANGLEIIFDETLLIEMIRNAELEGEHFRADGVRIDASQRGLHIMKDKKIMVK